jgi:hypothetical protein
MTHRMFCLCTQSVALIADQGNDHAVEVEEEHEEMEAELDERFLYTISSQSRQLQTASQKIKLTFL